MRPLLLLPLLALAACASDESPDVERIAQDAAAEAEREIASLDVETDGVRFTADLPGDVVDVVQTEGGEMELGVTDEVLFTRISEATRREVEAEMERETEAEEGLGGVIARAVTGAVAEGLATTVSVPLADVRDVRYEGGRVVIEMADGGESPFDGAKTDDRPLLEQFDAEAGERLAAAFDKAAGR